MTTKALRHLLRETAVNLESWARHQFISPKTSDAMEEAARKLREAENELLGDPPEAA
jgi:hypothetical protein